MQIIFRDMKLRLLKTEKDYQEALIRLEDIFDAVPGTEQGDELEILGVLIEKYENEHVFIDFPDPIEAIKFRMDQMGFSQNDLAEIIGQKSRASEVLNRKRKLSLDMIRKIAEKMHISSEVLIQNY
jgi:HTH-type transcriptional regulator/antitoxin HigA